MYCPPPQCSAFTFKLKLHCIVWYIALYCITMQCIAPPPQCTKFYNTLYYAVLQYIVFHYNALLTPTMQFIFLIHYCIAFYSTMHCSVFYNTLYCPHNALHLLWKLLKQYWIVWYTALHCSITMQCIAHPHNALHSIL